MKPVLPSVTWFFLGLRRGAFAADLRPLPSCSGLGRFSPVQAWADSPMRCRLKIAIRQLSGIEKVERLKVPDQVGGNGEGLCLGANPLHRDRGQRSRHCVLKRGNRGTWLNIESAEAVGAERMRIAKLRPECDAGTSPEIEADHVFLKNSRSPGALALDIVHYLAAQA